MLSTKSTDLGVQSKILPWQKFDGCSLTRLFLSLRRVWLARLIMFITHYIIVISLLVGGGGGGGGVVLHIGARPHPEEGYNTCYLGNIAVEERYEQHSYMLPR